MREEKFRRDPYFVVEVTIGGNKVLYSGTFNNFVDAWNKYQSFKGFGRRASVMIQRRFKEVNLTKGK